MNDLKINDIPIAELLREHEMIQKRRATTRRSVANYYENNKEAMREKCRNRYRIKMGLPLDAPLLKTGRKKASKNNDCSTDTVDLPTSGSDNDNN